MQKTSKLFTALLAGMLAMGPAAMNSGIFAAEDSTADKVTEQAQDDSTKDDSGEKDDSKIDSDSDQDETAALLSDAAAVLEQLKAMDRKQLNDEGVKQLDNAIETLALAIETENVNMLTGDGNVLDWSKAFLEQAGTKQDDNNDDDEVLVDEQAVAAASDALNRAKYVYEYLSGPWSEEQRAAFAQACSDLDAAIVSKDGKQIQAAVTALRELSLSLGVDLDSVDVNVTDKKQTDLQSTPAPDSNTPNAKTSTGLGDPGLIASFLGALSLSAGLIAGRRSRKD